MTTVDSSIRTRDFTQTGFNEDEIEAMRQGASSSEVLNGVRKDVGMKTAGVTVRGDDKSNAELKKEWEHEDIKEAVGDGAVHLGSEVIGGAVSLAGMLFSFTSSSLSALKNANERGEALAMNGERAAMHIALVNAVDLPQGYRAVENARWSNAGTGFTSPALTMATQLEVKDHKGAAVLQLHADRGMNAARELINHGRIATETNAEAIAKLVGADAHLKAQYDTDPAFRAGFDALVWSKQHDAKAYDETVKKLEARDACYAAASLSYRG